MSLSRTGDWKIVMQADGVDSEGKNTYQHIYQHKDGRKAYVGPGYCSEPDLEWILFQKDRETKAWNKRYAKREKNKFLCIRRCLAGITNSRSFVLSRERDISSTVYFGILGNEGWWLGFLQ